MAIFLDSESQGGPNFNSGKESNVCVGKMLSMSQMGKQITAILLDHVRIAICHPNYDKLCNLFDYGQLKNDYPFMS